MNPQTATAVNDSNSAPLHCQYRTASGRRCRLPAVAGMAVSDPHSGLCHKHAAERQQNLDQADLAAALIGDIEEFRSASHRAVDREAVTNDVDAEENASQDAWLEVIPDLPRPDCEDDVPVTTP